MKKRLLSLVLSALMALSLSACGGGSTADKTVRIATKPMTEQYILGEMLAALVEQAGYTPEITRGVGGGTSNIHPAMKKGDFDLYPEYTSSGYVLVLGHPAGEETDEGIWSTLETEYHDQFQMKWLSPYGFNNTYTVAVSKAAAEQYNLTKTSDLADVAGELTFGGNPDYLERADGFPRVCETYGLEFKSVKQIDIGLKYQAMESGDIDATNAYTTDAQLAREEFVALEDDLNLQVNYFCATVVREDTLERCPGLEEALEQMNGLISNDEMAQLNYQVEVEGKDEAEVARSYLTEKGLLK